MDLPFINYFKCPRNHESGIQFETAYKKVAEKNFLNLHTFGIECNQFGMTCNN